MINTAALSTLQKALLVANARVAVINGAHRTWCVGGDFVCDIPGYDGYAGTEDGLRKACEDLNIHHTFLERNGVTKVHVTTPLDGGAQLGLTVPLPTGSDVAGASMTTAVIAALQLHYMTHHSKFKVSGELIGTLAHIFDVSFGAGQSATAE